MGSGLGFGFGLGFGVGFGVGLGLEDDAIDLVEHEEVQLVEGLQVGLRVGAQQIPQPTGRGHDDVGPLLRSLGFEIGSGQGVEGWAQGEGWGWGQGGSWGWGQGAGWRRGQGGG